MTSDVRSWQPGAICFIHPKDSSQINLAVLIPGGRECGISGFDEGQQIVDSLWLRMWSSLQLQSFFVVPFLKWTWSIELVNCRMAIQTCV